MDANYFVPGQLSRTVILLFLVSCHSNSFVPGQLSSIKGVSVYVASRTDCG